MSKRYRLICVADLPDGGSFDDLDEAIAHSDAHYEVYDEVTGTWPGAVCQEEYDEAVARWKVKRDPAS